MDTKFNLLTLRICTYVLLATGANSDLDSMEPGQCVSKFDYDYRVLQKLVFLESKLQEIEAGQLITQKTIDEEKQKTDHISDQIIALNETVNLYLSKGAQHERTACRNGFLAYSGSCYYFGQNNTNFENAENLCAQLNSYLVEVETKNENEFLRNFLKSFISTNVGIHFWLGITDSKEEGVWRWKSNDSEATFKSWAEKEPNDSGSGEDCAVLSIVQVGWVDVPCTNSYRPLCEEKF